MTKEFRIKKAAERLLSAYQEPPKIIKFYCVLGKVAKSGLSRCIALYIIKDNEPYFLGEGRVIGCGMDMGYHTAENVFQEAFKPRIVDLGGKLGKTRIFDALPHEFTHAWI